MQCERGLAENGLEGLNAVEHSQKMTKLFARTGSSILFAGLLTWPAVLAPQVKTAPVTTGLESREACDPSYPSVCIPPPPPDLDCRDIPHRRFRVIGRDPHRFDGDHDGIGCESG